MSGGGVYATINNQNYVLGTIQGGISDASGNALGTVANYITKSEYYKLFPITGTTSKTVHNLIIGAANGDDDIRGSFQTTDVVASGNNNLILAPGQRRYD